VKTRRRQFPIHNRANAHNKVSIKSRKAQSECADSKNAIIIVIMRAKTYAACPNRTKNVKDTATESYIFLVHITI
jgi:hypothetical protein